MSEAFELESMISKDEDTPQLDNQLDELDMDADVDLDGEPDESVFIPPPFAFQLPPTWIPSSNESLHELPNQEAPVVRSSKRTLSGRDFYEGSI